MKSNKNNGEYIELMAIRIVDHHHQWSLTLLVLQLDPNFKYYTLKKCTKMERHCESHSDTKLSSYKVSQQMEQSEYTLYYPAKFRALREKALYL